MRLLGIDTASWYMDYEGQKLMEGLFQYIILGFMTLGFGWGYYCQRFEQTIYVTLGGVALAFLICLPPWPMYRRHPIKWLKRHPKQKSAPETS
ncbi:signal peptidase complex subunit 1 [Salpingoeca rosetta]|uniref:Signal peptidase complex subunit 1 n=1 Tax=Salpingoeca rosetta (strain ATCC 50818 / BSB-021) TaxID=946362 RepID=F2U914_SALR5|nr:signal peptidase complex subunit 1 [Salpingoeca rosetta]EGD73217.1 signal peptidase complex subunit 1 [Salpingoeca rosetta]|eukprot:XP_004994248.1 signal peptidase complex subunit 1 [Salpingoeca rosetta]